MKFLDLFDLKNIEVINTKIININYYMEDIFYELFLAKNGEKEMLKQLLNKLQL